MEKYTSKELARFVMEKTDAKPFMVNMYALVIYLQSCLNNKRKGCENIYPFHPSKWMIGDKSPYLKEIFELKKEIVLSFPSSRTLENGIYSTLLDALVKRNFTSILYHMKRLPIISITGMEYAIKSIPVSVKEIAFVKTIEKIPEDKLTVLCLLKDNITKPITEKKLTEMFK